MTEKDLTSQIRFSYGISLLRAVGKSLAVILAIGLLVILGELQPLAGSSIPLVALTLLAFLVLNLLGYIELAVSSPRKGGAYRLVQTSDEGSWLAFLAGWSLLLAGVSAGGILIQAFARQASYQLAVWGGLEIPAWTLGLAILGVALGLRMLPVRKSFRIDLLLALLILILIGMTTALPRVQPGEFKPVFDDWQTAFSLLLIAFFGLEISSATQAELRDHSRNSPRLLLFTPLLAGVLIILASLLLNGLTGPHDLSLGAAPLDIIGRVQGLEWMSILLSALSLLAIPLALDRVAALLTRQVYAMARDGFWPEGLTRTTPRFRTPLRIVLILAVLLGLTLLVPPLYLAKLGGVFFLLVLMLVNLSLARQKQIPSTFQLPIHPWIPALVLVIDLLVLLAWSEVLPAAAGLSLAGLLIYQLYSRHHCIAAKQGKTVFKTALEEETTKEHPLILVPVANPDTAESLLHLAGSLVRPEGGKVIALQVVTVPGPLPLSDGSIKAEADRLLLERAVDQATKEQFRVQTMTRVSRSVAEGILDTAREEDVDQILVGWSGGDSRVLSKSMGSVLDPVIKDAPCDVLVVKGFNWKEIKSILVASAGGPNAPIGARLACRISQNIGARVTGLFVQVGRASTSRMTENRRVLKATFSGLEFDHEPQLKVVTASSAAAGIIKEAEYHDLVLIGASEQGVFDQFVFGSLPQQIASQPGLSSIMVKGYSGAPEFWLRKILGTLFNLFPTLTTEEQLEVREDLIENSQPGRDYFVLIALSSIIASLGLLLNSPAVVIGAMLVAPLMSPILGFSLGIVLGEVRLVRTSLESVFKGVMATVIVSILVGLISPLKEMTAEILARTQPTLLDLFVALASGMAGAYALSRKDVSEALPGVAIAAALAPPLCVVGLGIANGNLQEAGGALLLFITNLITISLAGMIIFTLLGIHPLNLQPEIQKRVRRGITGITLLVVLITIPLAILMNGIIRQNQEDHAITEFLVGSPILENTELLDVARSQERDQLTITVTLRSAQGITQDQVQELAQALESELEKPLVLDIIALPVVSSK